MGRVFVISDLHIGHDREFLWEPRGFANVREHDETLVANWNRMVGPEDTVYVLGDVMLRKRGGDEAFGYGLAVLRSLNGKLIIVRGNHDSNDKVKLYEQCENVISADNAALYVKYPEIGGYTFYLSHYPTVVSHAKLKQMKTAIINLYGHTHQKEHFFRLDGVEHPYMYCCCMDAHECTPVLLDDVIEEIKVKRSAWRNQE